MKFLRRTKEEPTEKSLGQPRTEEERAARHEESHPGTPLPERGTGLGVPGEPVPMGPLHPSIAAPEEQKADVRETFDVLEENLNLMTPEDLELIKLQLAAIEGAFNEMIKTLEKYGL